MITKTVEKFVTFIPRLDGGCDVHLWDTPPRNLGQVYRVSLPLPRELWDFPEVKAELL